MNSPFKSVLDVNSIFMDMDNDRNHKLALAFNVACFFGYSGFLFAGRYCNSLSITNNTLSVVKILCFIQLILAYVQTSLYCVEEKSKGLKKKVNALNKVSCLETILANFFLLQLIFFGTHLEYLA